MRVLEIVGVMLGAALGGGARYVLGGWMVERWGASFPWHTLVINVGGAFLLGLLMALSAERGLMTPQVRLFLGVGLLGGFTTFSTLSYESIALVERGLIVQGAANMLGSAALGLVAVVAGLLVGRAI
ncbi:MAG TPA: fluoride efflux transporter CrcB [Coriobacteriia bacterium]|nr:fluoride efflux transporter CrcB [Coriobacteriia bacterium]